MYKSENHFVLGQKIKLELIALIFPWLWAHRGYRSGSASETKADMS
jgi:hypothetical protein